MVLFDELFSTFEKDACCWPSSFQFLIFRTLTLDMLQADEMLYRAVILTLVSYWIRDRLYEAGAEDVIGFPWGLGSADALHVGQYGALALGVVGGILAFTLRAWREAALIEKAQVQCCRQAQWTSS
jgi:hypothetical protein